MKMLFPIFLLLFCGCFDSKTPETYLIPDGYQGKITIVYEQKKGRDQEFEESRRLYRVDSNGILITKFKSEDGALNEEYYYIKSDGSRQRISIDSTIFWQDSIRIKTYTTKNYDSISIRYFGVAGRYGQVPYTQSIIGNGRFIDTMNFEKFDEERWQLISDKLK